MELEEKACFTCAGLGFDIVGDGHCKYCNGHGKIWVQPPRILTSPYQPQPSEDGRAFS